MACNKTHTPRAPECPFLRSHLLHCRCTADCAELEDYEASQLDEAFSLSGSFTVTESARAESYYSSY